MRALIAAIVVAMAGGAWAGDADDAPAPMARVRAIEAAAAHQRAAQQLAGDAARDELEACGQGYLGVYNDAPAAPDADQFLYGAAVCFAQGGSAGAAIALGEQLVAEFPTSRLAPAALTQLLWLHAALGEFARARDAAVRLAERYPAEREAVDALWAALAYSAALGDEAQLATLAARFERSYGAKRPDDVGRLRAHLAERQAERGDVDGAIASYGAVLKRWRGTPAERATVLMARAELQWQRACPVAGARGLCVRGDAALAVVARRKGDAADAVAGFAAVVQLAQAGDPDDLALGWARARARLHQVEAAVEAVVALGAVPALAVDQAGAPTPAALERMRAWLRDWQQAMATADRAGTDAFAAPEGASAVAVAERLARMYQHAAATLIAAPVPRTIVGTPAATVYRDQLAEVAAPLRLKADAAAEACLHKAAALGIVDDAVASCGAIRAAAAPATWALAERVPGYADGAPAPTPE